LNLTEFELHHIPEDTIFLRHCPSPHDLTQQFVPIVLRCPSRTGGVPNPPEGARDWRAAGTYHPPESPLHPTQRTAGSGIPIQRWYIPTSRLPPQTLPTLSCVTATNLLFCVVSKFVRLGGPSGGLRILAHWDLDGTLSHVFFFFLIQMSIPLTTYMSTGAAGFSNTQLNYTEQHATDVGVRQRKEDTVTDH